MKVLVIFLFGVNLICCVELNGLISPPASNSHYSTGYGIGGDNSGISSAIKLSEANNNVNSVGRGLPATHSVQNLAPSISTSGNVGIISASPGSSNINQDAPQQRLRIPVPQPYPVTITRPAPVPNPVPISAQQPVPIRVSRPFPVPITQPIQVPIQRPAFVNVPQPIQPFAQPLQVPFGQPVQIPFAQSLQLQFPQPHPAVFQQPIPFRISHPFGIPVPISTGITGHGGIIGGGIQEIHGGIGSIEGIGQYSGGPLGGGQFGGIIIGGADENVVASGALRGSDEFVGSNYLNEQNYGGHSFTRPDQGISQNYESNGGYKY